MSADAGAQHVDAVERGLGFDLFGLALVGEAGVGDLDVEVLLDLVALERRADREADLVGAAKRAALDALGDLCSPRSVAASSSSRLRARSAATSGLRQTISRSPG